VHPPLRHDEAFRQRASARARASVIEQYDEQTVFSRFANLLRQLAARPA